MSIDPQTIIAYTSSLLALISVLFFVFWAKGGWSRSLFWCALPFLAGMCGGILMAVSPLLPGVLALQLGAWFILVGYGFGWQAMRSLYGRKPVVWQLLLPPTAWVVLTITVLDPWHLPVLRSQVIALIVMGFDGLAAYEFWRARDEKLPARAALFWVFLAYAVYTLVKMPFLARLPQPLGAGEMKAWAVAVYNATVMTQVILVASFIIALTRERVALQNYRMATLDPLSGIGNRRAFNDFAHRWAAQKAASPRHAAGMGLLLLDIDHFKSINDRFGHDIGDDVIRIAANTAVQTLKEAGEVFRMGGEEFVCLLPQAAGGQAFLIAERLRRAFKANTEQVGEHKIGATVSIGIASAQPRDDELVALLSRADAALYMAKQRGRNRTIVAENEARQPIEVGPDETDSRGSHVA